MRLIKYWPPYLAAGISVREFDLDRGLVVSQMKLSKWNANYFGTMFGGSLYAMCDPFYVFILSHRLGRGYYIWDIESKIKFKKATSRPVHARFEISDDEIDRIRQEAETGSKVLPEFRTEIRDADDQLIAEVEKTLYVKRKR